jgi:hypothetical protein
MAKKSKAGKDKQQPAKGKQGGAGKKPAPAADKKSASRSKPAPRAAAPAQPAASREPLPAFVTPVNIGALVAGLVLLGLGAVKFYSIQYGKAPTGDRIYLQGFLLFCAGVIIPCLGVAPLRKILFPGNKPGATQNTGQETDNNTA